MTERMSIPAYRKLMKIGPNPANEDKPSKYNNKKCVIDGIRFDSQAEGAYYLFLKNQERLGEIDYFLRQVPIHLPGGTSYRVDFQVFSSALSPNFPPEYVDVKGFETAMFKMKKKQVEALYPIVIRCITAKEIDKSYRITAKEYAIVRT